MLFSLLSFLVAGTGAGARAGVSLAFALLFAILTAALAAAFFCALRACHVLSATNLLSANRLGFFAGFVVGVGVVASWESFWFSSLCAFLFCHCISFVNNNLQQKFN